MSADVQQLKRLETRLVTLCETVRLLPNLTPANAAEERRRGVRELERGRFPSPRWKLARARTPSGSFRLLDQARRLAEPWRFGTLYLQRLDELELELALLDALGDRRRVQPLAARRYGTGDSVVTLGSTHVRLADVAARILQQVPPRPHEPRVLPADAPQGETSAASVVRGVALGAGLSVRVRIEPRLASGAAAGDRTVFLADRDFGVEEITRMAVHEVLGHLVSAANGRTQSLRLLELGTAGGFEDQEGVAIQFEQLAGLLGAGRLRTLAARVLAADWMYDGALFGETCMHLIREHGFEPAEAFSLAERAYRGGGVARDVVYLRGWLRVRAALQSGEAQLDELRAGRLSLQALPLYRELRAAGLARAPTYRPNLARSLAATPSGTVPLTSPPSDAASLTRLELT